MQLLCREQAVKLWTEREQFEKAGVKLVCLVHEWIQREIDGFAPKYWGEHTGRGGGEGAQHVACAVQPCSTLHVLGSRAGQLPAGSFCLDSCDSARSCWLLRGDLGLQAAEDRGRGRGIAPGDMQPSPPRKHCAAAQRPRLPVPSYVPRQKPVLATASAAAGGELYYDEGKAFYAAVHGGKVKKGSLLALLNPLGEAWKNMRRAKGSGLVEESNMNGDGLTLGGGWDRAHGGVQGWGMSAAGREHAGAPQQCALPRRQTFRQQRRPLERWGHAPVSGPRVPACLTHRCGERTSVRPTAVHVCARLNACWLPQA